MGKINDFLGINANIKSKRTQRALSKRPNIPTFSHASDPTYRIKPNMPKILNVENLMFRTVSSEHVIFVRFHRQGPG